LVHIIKKIVRNPDKFVHANKNLTVRYLYYDKYNRLLGSFYLQNFNNKIFIALKSETEKKYDSLLDDYINKVLTIYDKLCFDDDEMNIPKELKFYDYQSNEKYTNKYIVFDNLYDQIVLKIAK
jgi:hypothetical protein